MNTVITSRKTPHAVKKDLFGERFVATIDARCFNRGNVNDQVVIKRIPIAQCYVNEGCQDIPDNELTVNDVRPYHVDVWNAKAKNLKKFGIFKTNWEINEYLNYSAERKRVAKTFETFLK
jgi:hypothetical protein